MEKEKYQNICDKVGIRFHRKLSFKLIPIGILILLLLIPKIMILSLINERDANASAATHDIMSKWSNSQILSGPILTIPYKKPVYNETKEKYVDLVYTATFLPKQLNIKGQINPKKLYRSIYDVVVYQAEINFVGSFEHPDFTALNIPQENVLWEQAEIQVSISDLRGINKEVKMNWSEKELTFSPGLTTSGSAESGISVNILDLSETQTNNFQFALDIKGSKSLRFTPVGKKTELEISSSWNDPSFTGNFLPTERQITKEGFTAQWKVLHFNRNFPQQWTSENNKGGVPSHFIHDSDFGVELVSLANYYQKNTRSAKYSILIIIITFTIFFMYEVFSKQRIHPFQYIMVGGAITLFYLLLLSITEHLGFNMAYLIATLAVLMLVFLYSRTFMPKLKNSAGVGLALSACFGFVFVLLQLESFALLTGSVGIFILLAILMYSTRKVNWYKE